MYFQDNSHIWQFDNVGKYDKISASIPAQDGLIVLSVSAYTGKTYTGYDIEILPGSIGDYIPNWVEFVVVPNV